MTADHHKGKRYLILLRNPFITAPVGTFMTECVKCADKNKDVITQTPLLLLEYLHLGWEKNRQERGYRHSHGFVDLGWCELVSFYGLYFDLRSSISCGKEKDQAATEGHNNISNNKLKDHMQTTTTETEIERDLQTHTHTHTNTCTHHYTPLDQLTPN